MIKQENKEQLHQGKLESPLQLLKLCALPFVSLIVFALVGYLLLVISYSLPREAMTEHLAAPIELYDSNYDRLMSQENSVLDVFTDSLEMLIAVHPSEQGAWKDALLNPHYLIHHQDAAGTIQAYYVEHRGEVHVETYERYWHGYLLYLRPMLRFFNYGQIRAMLMMVHFSMILLLVYLFSKRCKQMLLPYGIFLLFLNPVSTMLSLQFTSSLLAANVGLLLVLYLWEKWGGKKIYHWSMLFLCIGALTSYIDYLTYPLVSLGVPLVLLLLLTAGERQTDRNASKGMDAKNGKNECIAAVLRLVGPSCFWGLGFACMWGMKWILASIITGENVIANAREAAATRSAMDLDGVGFSYLGIVKKNYLSSLSPAWMIPMVAMLVVLLFVIAKNLLRANKKVGKKDLSVNLAKQKLAGNEWVEIIQLILAAAFPLLWIAGFSQHSYSHSYFAYRDWGVSVCAITAVLVLLIEKCRTANSLEDKV